MFKVRIITIMLVSVLIFSIPALGKYGGGQGTEAEPYLIYDPNQMIAIGADPNDWDEHFKLMADINLALAEPNVFTTALIAPDTSSSIFFQGTPFTGVFDGADHVILNLTIDTAGTDNWYLSLFGQVSGENAQVKNLGMENVSITGGTGSLCLSGLCGINYGTFTNCYTTGSVSGYRILGGLCGDNSGGTISQCYTNGSVTGGDSSRFLGGLCGVSDGTISDCYSEGSVSGDSRLGGLCGTNEGTISNSYSEGLVIGEVLLGGLCGINYGTFTNCYATGSVNGNQYLGGLCGRNKGTISNCSATGYVTGGAGSSNLGGLCAENSVGSTISNCYATGYVTGGAGSSDFGGLLGYNGGSIGNCYATGLITGEVDSEDLGGLCGENSVGSTISNCYATGPVTGGAGSSDLGGLVGYNGGIIGNCYATGLITWGVDSEDLGGLCGVNTAIVYHSFWDKLTSKITTSDGGIGKTTAEMMDIDNYVGWGDNIWTIDDGIDYPHLIWENQPGVPMIDSPRIYSGGSGNPNDPYLIAEPNDLFELGIYSADGDKHYKLVNNIDMSGFVFDTRLIPIFSGVFDGDGYTINSLTIDTLGAGNDYLGLFGNIIGQAQVLNLDLANVSITGGSDSGEVGSLCGRNGGTIINCYAIGSVTGGTNSYNLGGLCGWNRSTMTNCYSTGSVTGRGAVGGLCGENNGTISNSFSEGSASGVYRVGGLCGRNYYGTINSCYATGSVTGDNSLGGLCGQNNYKVINCYSEGSVIGGVDSDDIGGLCGWNFSTISNCYSIGSVSGTGSSKGGLCGSNSGTISECFWDIETSGTTDGVGNMDPDPSGVIGKTTAEMITLLTFTTAGWDFMGETDNGIDDIWQLCIDGLDYPRLVWQFGPANFVHPGRVDNYDLFVLMNDWLSENSRCCDIFPAPTPDGIVNILDFTEFSQHWLEGSP